MEREEKLTTLRLPRKRTAIVIISILDKWSPAFFKRNPRFITVQSAEESLLFPRSPFAAISGERGSFGGGEALCCAVAVC